MTEQYRCKIFVVDDHAIVRHGLASLINQEPDMMVCGEAGDAPSALNRFFDVQPDLAIVDISLPSSSGIDLIKDMKLRQPDLSILVFSMHEESLYAERSLRNGSSGYVMKCASPAVLIAAIRKVRQGRIYLSEKMTEQLLLKSVNKQDREEEDIIGSLPDREFQVFQLIGKGSPSRCIARDLNLSVKSIEAHRESIKRKLGLKSAAELVSYAVEYVHSKDYP